MCYWHIVGRDWAVAKHPTMHGDARPHPGKDPPASHATGTEAETPCPDAPRAAPRPGPRGTTRPSSPPGAHRRRPRLCRDSVHTHSGCNPLAGGGWARVFATSPSLVRSRKHLQSSRFASGGGQTVLFRWGHKGIGRGTVQGGGGWRGGDGAQVSGQARVGLLGRRDKALRAARLNTPGTCLFPLPSRSLGPRNRYPGVRRAALSLQVLRRARPRLARLPVTAEGLAARPSPPPSHTAAPLPLCL